MLQFMPFPKGFCFGRMMEIVCAERIENTVQWHKKYNEGQKSFDGMALGPVLY